MYNNKASMYLFLFLAFPFIVFANVQQDDEEFIKRLEKKIKDERVLFEDTPREIRSVNWVKYALDHMVNIDQIARKSVDEVYSLNIPQEERDILLDKVGGIIENVDDQNLILLKGILQIHTWPTISKFGEQADRDAWLLVQHADKEHSFQENILLILKKLTGKKETNKTNYAYLYDRVAVSFLYPEFRKPQLFGTQGQCFSVNNWQPFPIKKPELLDIRRHEYGMSDFTEYKKIMDTFCK